MKEVDKFQFGNISTNEHKWGVTLTVDNATPISATIKCAQSGGNLTGKLQTGRYYVIEEFAEKDGWQEVPYYAEVAWTMEAYLIPMNDVTEWEVEWGWLYGELPVGKYRIGKEIMDYRDTGDYDTEVIYAEFEIK